MLYAIISEDVPDSLSLRKSARANHLARLEQLQAAGRLVLAGPHPLTAPAGEYDSGEAKPQGFSGSLVVAEFASFDEARTWADADPYVAAGVYARVTVKPFLKVLP